VVLLNVSARGVERFSLPRVELPVLLVHQQGRDMVAEPVADTLLLEPDLRRLTITWRVSHPLRRNLFELKEVVVGERRGRDPDWVKPRYASLGEYIRSRTRAAVQRA